MEKSTDYIFTEYHEMLEDKRMLYKSQISIITLFVTTCGIALSVAVSSTENVSPLAILFILMDFIPAIATFFAILWVDQVYRHICLLNYFLVLGEEIRKNLSAENGKKAFVFSWMTREKSHSKSVGSYKFRYGVIVAMFFSVAIASAVYGGFIYDIPVSICELKPRVLPLINFISVTIIVTHIVIIAFYIHMILKMYNEGASKSTSNAPKK